MNPDTLPFTKGHGTHNDFVVIMDESGEHEFSPALVRALCDRRGGVGADGLLRVVRAGALSAGAGFPVDMWFMDYRNADGTIAEMCGNGSRVFGAYVERECGEDLGAGMTFATRAGERVITRRGPGVYSVSMGRYSVPEDGRADAVVATEGIDGERAGVNVDMGNPHTVVVLDSIAMLDMADLTRPPVVSPVPPDGTNVELVVVDSDQGARGVLRMRVHERGVGETQSCGTGACAAAVAAYTWAGPSAPNVWDVTVPGGALVVRIADGAVELQGPAILIADGIVDLMALASGGA